MDEIEFDQLYIMLKILMPKAKQLVSYHYPNKRQYVFKKVSEVMLNVHDKFGVEIQSERHMKQYQNELIQKMNAVGGFEDCIFGGGADGTSLISSFYKDQDQGQDDKNPIAFYTNEQMFFAASKLDRKIRKANQDFLNRHRCYVNFDSFHKLFFFSDIYKT